MQIIAYSRWDEIVPHAESWDRLARGVPSHLGLAFKLVAALRADRG